MAIVAARRRPGSAGAVLAEHVLLMGLIAAVALATAMTLGPVVVAKIQVGVAAFAGAGPAPNAR